MITNEEARTQIENYKKLTKLNIGELLQQQLDEDQDLINNQNYSGHMTASGLVIFENKVLLIYHNKINKWLQPGGHLEYSDKSIMEAAKREVEEETGLKVKIADWHIQNNSPIMIDTHPIPAHKGLPAHFHHDFRYIFIPEDNNVAIQIEEVSDFVWVKIDDEKVQNEESNKKACQLAKQFGII